MPVYYVVISGFCYSGRRRHTRGALVAGVQTCALRIGGRRTRRPGVAGPHRLALARNTPARPHRAGASRPVPGGADAAQGRRPDRKRGEAGKSVSVRVDIGGRRIIEKTSRVIKISITSVSLSNKQLTETV